jgi:hypothetical protein
MEEKYFYKGDFAQYRSIVLLTALIAAICQLVCMAVTVVMTATPETIFSGTYSILPFIGFFILAWLVNFNLAFFLCLLVIKTEIKRFKVTSEDEKEQHGSFDKYVKPAGVIESVLYWNFKKPLVCMGSIFLIFGFWELWVIGLIGRAIWVRLWKKEIKAA